MLDTLWMSEMSPAKKQEHDMKAMQYVKFALAKLGAVIVKETPRTDLEDADIQLGGKYDGLRVSVGAGYYSVTRETLDGQILFIHGAGCLTKELELALAD